ncbi:MAG: subtilase family serine protease [Glaciecola sp.]|jgi:subtilase family serine protease
MKNANYTEFPAHALGGVLARNVFLSMGLGLLLAVLLPACGGGTSSSSPGGSTGAGNLRPISVSAAPNTLTAGDAMVVADTVRFEGTGTAGPFQVGVYVSTDLAFDSSDLLVGSRLVTSLAAGSDSPSAQTYNVPASLATGTYFLALVVDDQNDVSESSETDNVLWATSPLIVNSASLPDLEWLTVSFSPASANPGDSLTLNDSIRNTGSMAATVFRTGVYLSTDNILDAGDVLLSFRSLTGLNPASVDTQGGQVTLPSSLASGVYQVLWMADDLGQVSELDEANNLQVGMGTLAIGSGGSGSLSELVPESITFSPATQDAGQLINVSESVRNAGLNPAPTFQVAVYLSTDAVHDGADRLLGFRSLASLDAGDTSSVLNQPFQLPADLSAGVYRLILVVDDSNLAQETNENNNTLVAAGSLGVTVPPLPDLVCETVTFTPGTVSTGGAITVNESVRNTGTAAAGTFRVGIYLSPNPSVSQSDTLLGSRVVNDLGAGQASGSNAPYTVPAGLPSGTYFLGVFVDDLTQVVELSDGNNVQMAAGTLNYSTSGNPMANLFMDSIEVNLGTVEVGNNLSIITTVTNSGDENAPPFLVGIYLSDDADVTTADLPLVVRSVHTGLNAGFTSVQSAPVLVPASIPAGTYYVGAIVDKDGTVTESNESDNLALSSSQLAVTQPAPPAPDLVALTPTGPSGSTPVGSSETVEIRVQNSGELDSGAFRAGIYLSSDSTIDGADVFLGSINFAGLVAGASTQASISVPIPTGTAPGTYRIGTWVDDLGSVNESGRDSNNTALVAGDIQVP